METIISVTAAEKRRTFASASRLWKAVKAGTLKPNEIAKWWSDLTQRRDPHKVYLSENLYLALLKAIEVLQPRAYNEILKYYDASKAAM